MLCGLPSLIQKQAAEKCAHGFGGGEPARGAGGAVADLDAHAVLGQCGEKVFIRAVISECDDEFLGRRDDGREDGGEDDAFVYAVLADFDDAVAGHDFDGEIREEAREVEREFAALCLAKFGVARR